MTGLGWEWYYTAVFYYAVESLKENAVDDPFLFDEYEVIFEDLQEVIKDFMKAVRVHGVDRGRALLQQFKAES